MLQIGSQSDQQLTTNEQIFHFVKCRFLLINEKIIIDDPENNDQIGDCSWVTPILNDDKTKIVGVMGNWSFGDGQLKINTDPNQDEFPNANDIYSQSQIFPGWLRNEILEDYRSVPQDLLETSEIWAFQVQITLYIFGYEILKKGCFTPSTITQIFIKHSPTSAVALSYVEILIRTCGVPKLPWWEEQSKNLLDTWFQPSIFIPFFEEEPINCRRIADRTSNCSENLEHKLENQEPMETKPQRSDKTRNKFENQQASTMNSIKKFEVSRIESEAFTELKHRFTKLERDFSKLMSLFRLRS